MKDRRELGSKLSVSSPPPVLGEAAQRESAATVRSGDVRRAEGNPGVYSGDKSRNRSGGERTLGDSGGCIRESRPSGESIHLLSA